MENTLFSKNDSSFVCANCGKFVDKLGYSSRNHCPHCLCSLHVDVNPGDRASECGGVMVPVAVTIDSKRGFVITHKCKKCGFVRNNRSQKDDDTDLLIHLSNPYNIKHTK
ncbi:MAG: RNHCP domain-containing protein [Eubacteriales bacterium]|jgi:predicted Zn-ribbon and HTH transcriptional regulator